MADSWREGRALSFVAILLFFAVWIAITADGFGIVSEDKWPPPSRVVSAAVTVRSVLGRDIVATATRVLTGFGVGVVAGVGLGLVLSYSRKLLYFFDPIIESIRPVPVIAMIPFFLLWFGIAEIGKFILVVLGVFAVLIVTTIEAVRNVRPVYLKAAATLGASKIQIYRRIVLPGMIPELVGPLRVAAALSFTLVVAAEFMGAQSGLGYRILEARRLFNTHVILLGVMIITVGAALLDQAIRRTTGYLTRWSERESTGKKRRRRPRGSAGKSDASALRTLGMPLHEDGGPVPSETGTKEGMMLE